LPCTTSFVVAVGWPVSGKEDEETVLRDLAELYPTLKEMRAAAPPAAALFLSHTRNQSEHWPAAALIDGYLDALP